MQGKSVSAPSLYLVLDDTHPGNVSDHHQAPLLLVTMGRCQSAGLLFLLHSANILHCSLSAGATICSAAGRQLELGARLELEDEAALKSVESGHGMQSVIVTWCNNDPGSDLSSADLTQASPHWGLRDLGASTCLASQQRVSGRVAACSRTSVSLFVDCFPHRILQASYVSDCQLAALVHAVASTARD